LFSSAGLMFVASLSDLATKRFRLVGRDGEETPLIIGRDLPATTTAAATKCPAECIATEDELQDAREATPGSKRDDDRMRRQRTPLPRREPTPAILKATAAPIDEATSWLTVELKETSRLVPPQVLVVGGQVFGYSDAPIERDLDARTLSAVVPTALLREHPHVEVTALLAPERYRTSAPVEGTWLRGGERLVAFDKDDTHTVLLLYGVGLTGAAISVPQSAQLEPFMVPVKSGSPVPVDEDRLAKITVPTKDVEGREHMVLQRLGQRPVLVTLPPSTPPKKPAPTARERIVVGVDQAVFDSEGLATLSAVSVNGKSLGAKVAKDGKSVTVSGLIAAGATGSAGTVTVTFEFGETKVTAKLEVVSARVETVTGTK
jgi:hypothetical protein